MQPAHSEAERSEVSECVSARSGLALGWEVEVVVHPTRFVLFAAPQWVGEVQPRYVLTAADAAWDRALAQLAVLGLPACRKVIRFGPGERLRFRTAANRPSETWAGLTGHLTEAGEWAVTTGSDDQ